MIDSIVNIVAAGAPDVNVFVQNARDFIAPIFLLIIGGVALSFLFRRQLMQFLQFFILAVLIGVLFYVPGIVERFSLWVSTLFG